MPSEKKKIAYNETFSYLGGGGVKKIPTIPHLINGTFFMGRGGLNSVSHVSFLKKCLSRRRKWKAEVFQPTKASKYL